MGKGTKILQGNIIMNVLLHVEDGLIDHVLFFIRGLVVLIVINEEGEKMPQTKIGKCKVVDAVTHFQGFVNIGEQ